MKLLFFDMEFADGKVPGSIYSFGYLVTDEDFEILTPPTDLLIDPESTWNEYVEQNILAYPKEEVEASPNFSARYEVLKALFEDADLAVGFALNNDLRALRKDCERYGLPMIQISSFDTERLCRMMEEHKDAHGLGGYVQAWCGEVPDHRHRSDGDAYATMLLFKAICDAKHVTPEMMALAYPECRGAQKEKAKKSGKKSPRRGYYRRKKKESVNS
ncbi:MAG: hypothetical protein IJX19_02505 [Clostridia bacterium]|nr:hypothetical protein [Clostridia bacterium]